MTTSSQSEPTRNAELLGALPRLPRGAGGPVFAEPWEAQAFALAVKLSEQGYFTWTEWAAALAAELQAAASRGEPDDGSHYYQHWLAALDRLVTAKALADPAALARRKQDWAEAYRHTPHGKPVELGSRAHSFAQNTKTQRRSAAKPQPKSEPRITRVFCSVIRGQQTCQKKQRS